MPSRLPPPLGEGVGNALARAFEWSRPRCSIPIAWQRAGYACQCVRLDRWRLCGRAPTYAKVHAPGCVATSAAVPGQRRHRGALQISLVRHAPVYCVRLPGRFAVSAWRPGPAALREVLSCAQYRVCADTCWQKSPPCSIFADHVFMASNTFRADVVAKRCALGDFASFGSFWWPLSAWA